jgi:hypothetical protein
MRLKLRPVDEYQVAIELPADAPLLPKGIYTAIVVGHTLRRAFRTPKVRIRFEILEENGEHRKPPVYLFAYYNVRTASGHRVTAGPHSHYARDWRLVAGRRPSRRDRLAPSIFCGKLLRVEVCTVVTDSHQQQLDPINHYSRVVRVVGVVTR